MKEMVLVVIGHLVFLLLVVIVYFFSSVIVEVMHSWTKFAFHDARTRVCFVFACLEAHMACVVLLTLFCFVFCCILSDPAESCIMCVGFTKDALPRC